MLCNTIFPKWSHTNDMCDLNPRYKRQEHQLVNLLSIANFQHLTTSHFSPQNVPICYFIKRYLNTFPTRPKQFMSFLNLWRTESHAPATGWHNQTLLCVGHTACDPDSSELLDHTNLGTVNWGLIIQGKTQPGSR